MSMANMVRLPTPFMMHPGKPSIYFSTWLPMFDNNMQVIDVTWDKWLDKRKRAVVLHVHGMVGRRLFYTLQDTGTNYTSVEGLKKHFVPKLNIITECHTFCQKEQWADEMINQFIFWMMSAWCTMPFW